MLLLGGFHQTDNYMKVIWKIANESWEFVATTMFRKDDKEFKENH